MIHFNKLWPIGSYTLAHVHVLVPWECSREVMANDPPNIHVDLRAHPDPFQTCGATLSCHRSETRRSTEETIGLVVRGKPYIFCSTSERMQRDGSKHLACVQTTWGVTVLYMQRVRLKEMSLLQGRCWYSAGSNLYIFFQGCRVDNAPMYS